jgi:hypothetical protein
MANLFRMRQSRRRALVPALLLGLPAALALLAIGSARQTPSFLVDELGAPAPNAPLVRHPARGLRVELRRDGYAVRHHGAEVSLASPAGVSWQRFTHGASRATPFGRETIIVGPRTTEQFLTVDDRQGERTWRWRLAAGPLTPRVNPDGSVAFHDGGLADLAIEQARILTPAGRDVTPPELRWGLRKDAGRWSLILRFDDAQLPLPYVIDPAITLRTTATSAATSGAASLTINRPGAVVAGDFLLALVNARGGTSRVITAPAGWTLVRRDNNGTSVAQAVYRKVATASEPLSYTWTFNASIKASGGILPYVGVDSTAPIDTSSAAVNSFSSSSATAPSVATAVANDRIVGLFGIDDNLTWTPPTGMTERWDARASNGSGSISSEAADVSQASAGATGNKTATASGGGFSVAQLIALRVDATPPPAPTQTIAESSPDSAASGSTLYYRPAGADTTFTVTSTASDPESGVQMVTFPGLNGGFTPTTSTNVTASPYTQTYSWTTGAGASGAKTVTVTDNAGNTSTGSFTLTPDSTAPVTTDDSATVGSAWQNGNATVTLSPSDAGAGVATTYYTTDGSNPTTASAQGTSVTVSGEGTHTVKYFSQDNVGNSEAVRAAGTQIRIDTTPPSSATLSALPATVSEPQTLTGSGADALSGVTSIDYFYCAGPPCVPATFIGSGTTGPNYSFTWDDQPPDGNYAVGARVYDAAGNYLDSAPGSITIDNAPDTSIDSGPSDPTNATNATFAFSANESPVTWECQLDGSGFTPCTTPVTYTGLTTGAHVFQARATDGLGNVGTAATYPWIIDSTAPNTTVDSGPADPTGATSATFTFSASELGSTFECQLDGGAFAACSTPATYTGLSGGSHTFDVRATDPAGNLDATPASFTWMIDVTAPTASVDSGPADPTNATSATFGFSANEPGSTFECRLDGGGYSACTSPKTYTSLAGGAHSFDVRATDPVGNTGSPATASWTVDLAAPDTAVTSGPGNPSGTTSATFTFSASEPGSTFQCQVDGGGFAACTSPKTYTGLGAGSHTFQVRAIDPAGNTDPSPASDTWTIDLGPPTATIDSGPPDPTNSTGATFTFGSSEPGSTFECQLDGGAYTACTTPKTYTGLAAGSHTFRVRAIDAVGNVGSPATQTWSIDLTAPTASVDSAPASPTNATTALFTFSASEPGSTFACRLDGGGYLPCSSPKAYVGLSAGSHTFDVRATDAAGNSGSPASASWTIDLTAPDTSIMSGPSDPSGSASATFTFSATEPGSTFQCQLDGGGYTGCSSPKTYTGLGAGAHTVQVHATDPAGNTDGTPAAATWTIDLTPPTATVDFGPADPVNATAATFTFSSSEPGSTFECQLDAGAYAACTTPKSYAGVGEGTHTFRVRAIDGVGNVGSPAAHSWRIDTTAPTASVDSAPAALTNSAAATFTFSADEAGSTFQCQLDGGGYSACTSPKAYAGLAGGAHTFDVRATDAAGNTGSPAGASWTIDLTAPQTTIASGPTDPSGSGSGTFTFTATEPGSTFECQVDGAGFAACTSPKTYTGLGAGSHTFQARATDPAGNTDPTPASRTWTIDFGGPIATVDTGPADPTGSTNATFTFSSGDLGATFECQLDAGAYAACSTPKSYAGLAEGTHTFRVRATDTVGNVGSPAAHTWRIDTTAPTASVDSAPPALTNSATTTFTFSANEAGSTFACQLDGSAYAPCASPRIYSGLGDGAHTFRVKATDVLGNAGAPAAAAWTVDTGAPAASLGDPGANLSGTVTLAATASDPNGIQSVRFERSAAGSGTWSPIDTDTAAPYSADLVTKALADGVWDFRVVAIDAAGNTSLSGVVTPRVDNTAPSASVSAAQIFARAPIDVSATASDDGSGVASLTFERAPRGSVSWVTFATVTTPPYTTKFDPAGLADGPYDVRALVTDAAGNVARSTTSVTVATNGLAVALANPGAVLTRTVALTAATAGTGAQRVVFEIKRSTTNAWLVIAIDTAAPWSAQLDTQALRDGEYDVRATTDDADGLSASDVRTGIVVDNTAPVLVSSSPAGKGKVPARGAQVVLTASESLTRVTDATLDGKTAKAPAIHGSKVTYALGALSPGTHAIAGRLEDRAGLSAPFSLQFVVEAPLTQRLGAVSRKAANVAVPVTLSRAAALIARLVSPAGKTVASRRFSAAKGTSRVAFRLTAAPQPGHWAIVVRATAGSETVTRRVTFTVRRALARRGPPSGTWLIVKP